MSFAPSDGVKSVSEYISYAPLTIGPEHTVREAAERMRVHDVGALPVVAAGRLHGILTDRDIVVRAVAPGLDLAGTLVRDIMTPHLVTCFLDEDVMVAARSMVQHTIRRVVVVDRRMQLVGIISIDDIAARRDLPEAVAQVLARASVVRGLETDGLPFEQT